MDVGRSGRRPQIQQDSRPGVRLDGVRGAKDKSVMEEEWRVIPEFPNYKISSFGRVYSISRDHIMSVSTTNHGHSKITLANENGERCTRSVTLLVAEAFVPGRDVMSDQVVVLDGDHNNACVSNLVWRPRWFAWQYARQLRVEQPLHYRNLPVIDITTDQEYDSIVQAGVTEGLLFSSIWRSTYTGYTVYPNDSVFEILKRV